MWLLDVCRWYVHSPPAVCRVVRSWGCTSTNITNKQAFHTLRLRLGGGTKFCLGVGHMSQKTNRSRAWVPHSKVELRLMCCAICEGGMCSWHQWFHTAPWQVQLKSPQTLVRSIRNKARWEFWTQDIITCTAGLISLTWQHGNITNSKRCQQLWSFSFRPMIRQRLEYPADGNDGWGFPVAEPPSATNCWGCGTHPGSLPVAYQRCCEMWTAGSQFSPQATRK